MKLSQIKIEKSTLAILLLYPLLPFISILLLIAKTFTINYISKNTYSILVILLSIFLGIVNSTKIPESDLINYISKYSMINNFSFVEYLIFTGKDPAFYCINFVIYHITNGNISSYIAIITIIPYLFFLSAIVKYGIKMNFTNSQLMLSLIIGAFFPQLFSLSAHLIRQFLVGSLLMFYLVDKIFYHKNNWIILLTTIFIHFSSLLFIPLIFMNFFQKKLRLSFLIYMSFFIAFFVLALQPLLPVLISKLPGSFLFYALSRLTGESKVELEGLSMIYFVFTGVLLFIIIKKIYADKNTYEFSKNFVHFGNIFLCLVFYIFLNLSNSEIAVRFAFYLYFFFPFIFPLFVNRLKTNLIFLDISFSAIFLLFFIYRLEFGTWTYSPISDLFLENPLMKYIL